MLLNVITETTKCISVYYPNGKLYTRKIANLVCDECAVPFTRMAGTRVNRSRHFCSVKCQSKSQRTGILACVKEQTLLAHFGVTSPAKCEAIKQRMMKTNISKRGVAWPTQNSNVIQKQVATNLSRYGVKNVFQLAHVKQKANSVNACMKRHETMKRNGTYRKSRSEDRFYEFLCLNFGNDNVVRQVPIENTRWAIDFYVRSIDTYIQFDGAFWHGLDRPIDVIKEFKTPRDRVICHKYDTDRKQDKWFEINDKRLIRIVDKEFSTGVDVLQKIKEIANRSTVNMPTGVITWATRRATWWRR